MMYSIIVIRSDSALSIQTIIKAPPLESCFYFAPVAASAVLIYLAGGLFMHRLSGRVLLVISGLGNVLCCLLFALMPPDGSYWAWILPAMIGESIGVEITFNVSNVFITTALPLRHQDAAGGLINTIIFVAISVWLAVANIVVSATSGQLASLASFRVAFWLAFSLSWAAVILFATIRVGRADTDLTCDEKETLDVTPASHSTHSLVTPPAGEGSLTACPEACPGHGE